MQSRASYLRKTLNDNSYFENQLRQFLPNQTTNLTIQRPRTSPPMFELPPIPDIHSCILEAGAPPTLAKSLSRVYHTRANHLYEVTFNKLHQIWCQLEEAPDDWATLTFQNAVHMISNVFSSQLRRWRTQTLEGIAQRQRNDRTGRQSCRPAFNTEYVPLLESYFKVNAYPTASDRASLAKKTGMTPRQIEVWFQNHRNRASKNGQKLNRLKDDQLSPDSPLLNLAQSPPRRSRDSVSISRETPTRSTPSSPETRSAVLSTASRFTTPPPSPNATYIPSASPPPPRCPLDPPAPPHAFPMRFPPVCDYNPFPVKETGQCQFPPIQWTRLPSQTNAKKRKRPISVDDFAEDFAGRLNLRRNGGSVCSELEQPPAPWYGATHVSLCRGRHPALTLIKHEQGPTPRMNGPVCRSPAGRHSRPSRISRLPLRTTRTRCISSSSVSTASSSSLPVTPENSPLPLPQPMDKILCLSELDIGTLRAFPDSTPVPSGFLAYAGSSVRFGLV